jgi:hypothetical protein
MMQFKMSFRAWKRQTGEGKLTPEDVQKFREKGVEDSFEEISEYESLASDDYQDYGYDGLKAYDREESSNSSDQFCESINVNDVDDDSGLGGEF